VKRRFRRLFGPEPEGDVEQELAFHLEMRIRELIARGETPERARELTLRRFGDYESSRQACVEIDERRGRRMARSEYLTELKQDVLYAVRTLWRAPAFTTVALLTLALGIGANSAIFSVVYGVVLRGLAYRDAAHLYRVQMLYPDGTAYSALSAPDFASVRQDTRAFDQVEAYSSGLFTLLDAGEPREVRGSNVSDGLFSMLGFKFAAGRGFLREEHQPGHGAVAVLDYGFWQRAFGGSPGAIGRTVRIGGDPYTIVGVLAPGAALTAEADVYAPLQYGPTFSPSTATSRRSEYLAVIGHARAGADRAQVVADLDRLGRQLQTAFPNTNAGLTMTTTSLTDLVVGDVRRPLYVLLGAVGFVLLVACANVANLLLARASARQQEFSLRTALGASRGRLLRQLLTEAMVLGVAGAAGGLAIAYGATRALVAAEPADIPLLSQVGLNPVVVFYTIAVALVTSVAFGLLPALQATGARPADGLREGGRSGASSPKGHRVRAALVVAEMALAVVLLTGAGLLIRSFVAMLHVNPGFNTERAMAFRLALQGENYQKADQILARVNEVQDRIRALPGVTAVAATTVLPMAGRGSILDFAVEGAPPPPPNVNQEIAVASVTADYFKVLGTRLKRGRVVDSLDTRTSQPVAIVNEAAVRHWLPERDPIGRRVITGGTTYEVVGVVGDILQRDPGQPAAPQMFLAYEQRTSRTPRLVIRSANDPVQRAGAIREAVRSVDPNLAIPEFTPFEQLVSASVARPRFYMALLTLFAGVALLLAATGVFGVMSYAVAQRAREISIRMALGAQSSEVLWMIVGRAIALAGTGLVLGIAAALALGRLIQGQLFGVGLVDPTTLGLVAAVLGISACLASMLPAWRAAQVDPGAALR
jgi:predicted permease